MISLDAYCCGSFGSTDTRVATPPSLTRCARFVQRRCLPSRSVSRRRQAIKRRSRFVLHQDMQTVLRCQMAAFNAIGGIPSEILYDRMKTAVIGEAGGSIVYNRALIDFARHYGFQPKACRTIGLNEGQGASAPANNHCRDRIPHGRHRLRSRD